MKEKILTKIVKKQSVIPECFYHRLHFMVPSLCEHQHSLTRYYNSE